MRCDEPVACKGVLGVLHQRAEPIRERMVIGGEPAHPTRGVLGPEQRLEQRDLVCGERDARG